MSMPLSTILLFLLNFIDAVLTIYWVRNGLATEANQMMAGLLDLGNMPFLAVKLAIGGVTSFVLWRWRSKRLARYGLALSLAVYLGLMGIHFLTGLASYGYLSKKLGEQFSHLSQVFLAFYF